MRVRAHGTLGVGAVLSTHRTLRGSDFRHFALNSLMRRNLRPREEHNPPPRKPALRQMPGQKAENLSHFPFHRATFPVSFLTSETPPPAGGGFSPPLPSIVSSTLATRETCSWVREESVILGSYRNAPDAMKRTTFPRRSSRPGEDGCPGAHAGTAASGSSG